MEIVDFPSYKMVIFHCYVSLPDGMKCPYSPNNLYRESYAMIMYDYQDGHDGLHGL